MAELQYTWVNNPLPVWPQPDVADGSTASSSVTLTPADGAQEAFDTYSVVNLQPGKTYYWSTVAITKPVILNGNNATVFLSGEGPVINVRPAEFNSEVATNLSSYLPCIIRDVTFKGHSVPPDKSVDMSSKIFYDGAIYVNSVRGVAVDNCAFENFNGTALWFDEDVQVNGSQWDNFNSVRNCRFKHCRHGVSNGGRAEYGIADANFFQQCQIAFNVCGGNWLRTSNHIVNTRCGYLHTDQNWYMGRTGNQNPAHGTFVGNSINHANDNSSLWPQVYRQSNNPSTNVNLAGFYFADTNAFPPNFSGNTMYFCDMSIVNFAVLNSFKWSLTGCVFYNTAINVLNGRGTSMYIVGCTGNSVTTIRGIAAANISPDIGTITQREITREVGGGPPEKRRKKARAKKASVGDNEMDTV